MKQKQYKQKNTISPDIFGTGLKNFRLFICFCEIFINFALLTKW